MKQKAITLFFLVLGTALQGGIVNDLRHGLAVVEAEKGEWDKASSCMNSLLSVDYNNPEILYDAGVAAYKTGQFEQAHSYFDDCCTLSQGSKDLQERSYFNKGNACVDLNKLEDAIKAYESALNLNPDNKAAKHNLDKVKEMLEQQKQQQKDNQQKNEKKEDDKKDQQNDQQSESNDNDQSDDGSDSEENDQNNKKKNAKKSDNEQKNKKNKEDQKEDQSDKESPGNDNQSSSGKNKKTDQQKNNQPQEQGKQEPTNEPQGGQGSEQQEQDLSKGRDKRDSAGNQETKKEHTDKKEGAHSKEKQDAAKGGGMNKAQEQGEEKANEQAVLAAQQKNNDLFDKQHQWMAQLLQDQENADKEANKKMVKSALGNTMMENNGYNCW